MEKTKPSLDLRQIKRKCLGLLTKRDHSSSEMRQKLKRYYDFSSEDFSQAMDWLKELKYLPDEMELAQRLAKQYRKQGRGRGWIAAKLKTKGLRAGLSEDEGELAAASIALEKKLRGKSLASLDFNEKQRLGRQLTSRGFSPSLVRELLK